MDGRFNGQQIVPKAVVDDIRRGADKAQFAKAGYPLLPGWSYRPTAEMVIARYASHPLARTHSGLGP